MGGDRGIIILISMISEQDHLVQSDPIVLLLQLLKGLSYHF